MNFFQLLPIEQWHSTWYTSYEISCWWKLLNKFQVSEKDFLSKAAPILCFQIFWGSTSERLRKIEKIGKEPSRFADFMNCNVFLWCWANFRNLKDVFFFSIEIRKRYKNTKTSSRTLLYSVYFILWSYILSKLELYYRKKSFHRYTCPMKWCNFVLRSLLYFKPNLSCREKFMRRYRRQIFRRTHLVETLCTYFLFI